MLSQQKLDLNPVTRVLDPWAWLGHPDVIPLDILFKTGIISVSLLLDVFHISPTQSTALKLCSWGKKTLALFTYISVLGWRVKDFKHFFPLCASLLYFGSAPRTLKPGGIYTIGPN